VPVTPVAVLIGKVVDFAGEPVPAVRVCAFDPWAPTEARAETNTAVDGSYRLAVPVAAPVLLVAMPMQEASRRSMRLLRPGGQVADCNVPRDDLLPSCLPVAPRFGAVLEVPELRLG